MSEVGAWDDGGRLSRKEGGNGDAEELTAFDRDDTKGAIGKAETAPGAGGEGTQRSRSRNPQDRLGFGTKYPVQNCPQKAGGRSIVRADVPPMRSGR